MTWSRARAGRDDAFSRLDTAPLDLDEVRQALAVDAGGPARRSRGDLRRLALALVAVLVLAVLAVIGMALLPGRGPTPQAVAAPAASADTGWQNLELTTGWSATRDGARYRVENGVCYLQLHVADAGGVWAPNTELGVLPASAAPAWNLGFSAVRAGLPFGEVKVFSTGRVLVVAPSAASGGDLTVSGSFPVG